MMIGFCTSCMNRRWQLEETLAPNLEALAGTPHVLALCDFNSADDVGYLVERFGDFIDSGTLLYFRTTEPRTFHMSVAKNTAHRLALRRKPDVLFNLDADNQVTKETIAVVEAAFRTERDICLHNWDRELGNGACGRIALSAPRWQDLGGYDEQLLGMGWQDMDLLCRARAIGLRYQQVDRGVGRPISNTFEDKIAHVEVPHELAATSAHTTVSQLATSNIVTSLGRPVRLPFAEQRRFAGVLNFREPVVV